MSVEISRTFVTPAMASDLLKSNTRNRSLSDRRVTEYARDMAAGRFLFNGEAIKVADTGAVLDGQHRLEAIVRSGATVEMLLITGLPEYTQDTMDTGRRRSAGDALTINGVAYGTNLAAIARRVWQWDRQNYRFTGALSPTNTEVLETVEKYPTLHRSVEIAHRIATNFRVTTCTLNGTAHHLFLQSDPDKTAWFFTHLETGADLAEGHPVLALRNRLVTDKTMQRKIPFHQGLGYYIRSWNAVIEGKDMVRIVHAVDSTLPKPL